ncbi:MAG: aminotransferase class III-fold pyridoxal phosphate-dependent enzyme [Candidatus Kapaibacterium sp.]
MSKHKDNDYPKIKKSKRLLERAEFLIPAGTQTLAKGMSQYSRGVAPSFIERGKGSHVWDVDGNEYIDYTMGVGPISLGYCYPAVDTAIKAQLQDGITFSLVHPLEVEVAEALHEIIPNAESIRFSKTGCDVTSAAVRLARAFTGKNTILCCGYHGWHDWYIGTTDRNKGIPAETQAMTYTFQYNDVSSVLDAIDDDTAAIILEPMVFEVPKDNFLHRLRDICTERGILLIFDEMWTGFRLSVGGAQEYFGVKSDLACFSKAVANGMPLSILTGRKDVMKLLEHDVFFYTTFGGEALSLAAALATIHVLREKNVPAFLASQGDKLLHGYNEICEDFGITFTRCVGLGCRSMVQFDATGLVTALEMKTYMQQELLRYGILWTGFHNMCYSHTDKDIKNTLAAYRKILPQLKKHIDLGTLLDHLHGDTLKPVFRKTSNFNTKPKQTV